MFSLFKKKKITIRSLSIPDFGWPKTKDDSSVVQWINPEQTIAISIHFFELPPDIPTMANIEVLRDFYRQSISGINGGLIETELSRKGKLSFIRTVFKLAQEHSGMTYLASLTLPFKACSFVLKVQAAETGATGMREALIANRLMSENRISMDEEGYSNWLADPYDPNFKNGTLMNRSEASVYDNEFPDHPLTKARQLIKAIEQGIQWTPELETVQGFDK